MGNELIKIIGVGDLLKDIADGVGSAHHRLWETSNTPIGTLAVKDAEVKVDFEMSSSGSTRTADATLPSPLPFLGAKTFSVGTASTDARQSNRATITLRIVNVMPDNEDAAALKLMLIGITTALGQRKLTKDQQTTFAQALAAITALLNAGKLAEARLALDALVADFEKLDNNQAPAQIGGHLAPGKALKPK